MHRTAVALAAVALAGRPGWVQQEVLWQQCCLQLIVRSLAHNNEPHGAGCGSTLTQGTFWASMHAQNPSLQHKNTSVMSYGGSHR